LRGKTLLLTAFRDLSVSFGVTCAVSRVSVGCTHKVLTYVFPYIFADF
jgi:hypothetical protein